MAENPVLKPLYRYKSINRKAEIARGRYKSINRKDEVARDALKLQMEQL
jgi:hypothetical protein